MWCYWEKAMIPIIIKTSRLKNLPARRFNEGARLPKLVLKDEEEVVPAGGQHRHGAVMEVLQYLREDEEKLEDTISTTEVNKKLTEDERKEYHQLKDCLGEVKEKITTSMDWGLLVFEQGVYLVQTYRDRLAAHPFQWRCAFPHCRTPFLP